MKKFVLSTLGYTVLTFVLAVLWHIILFADLYAGIGYISREEPIFLFGLLSILLQASVLSYLYPLFKNGSRLIAAVGLYHWSMHVLSAAAKHEIAQLPLFFGIETVYLVVQFGVAAALYRLIYRR